MFSLMRMAGGVHGQSTGARGNGSGPHPLWRHALSRRVRSTFLSLSMLWLGLLGPSVSAHAERRVALVIGNSAYTVSPLGNPVNDARDMRAKLLKMGFAPADIVYREDLKAQEVGAALRAFRERLEGGGDTVALVFYAGHGVQVRGENYLPTVDSNIRSEEDLPLQSLRLADLMATLGQARTRLNLVFLDACRNNPLPQRTRSGSRGLARVDAPSGTLITFATQPNAVADDGKGRNGVFTQHLLAHMDEPGVEIEAMLKRVVRGVRQDTEERQTPWKEGAIDLDFFFVPTQGTAGVPAAPPVATGPAVAGNSGDRGTAPEARAARPALARPAAPPVFQGLTQDGDTAGLAARVADLLTQEAPKRSAWSRLGAAVLHIGFEEDLSRRAPRESRIYGHWTFQVADRPQCQVHFPPGWLGRSGLGGLTLSRDEAVVRGRELVVQHLERMLAEAEKVEWCPLPTGGGRKSGQPNAHPPMPQEAAPKWTRAEDLAG